MWVPTRLPVEMPRGGSTFVGRLDQFARFEEIWEAVLQESRQVVLIGGEPGIGKTRLAAEVAATVHDHGALVLWGGSGADAGIPYAPFVTAIERLLAEAPDGALAPLLDDSSGWLSRLIPRHRPDLDAPDPARRDTRRAMFDAVLTLLLALAAQQPVVLVLDDLHWADAPTGELLAHLVQSSARARLLILVTHRTTAPDRSDEFTYVMADLYRLDGVTRIDLGGLETRDVADYLVREAPMRQSAALASAAVLRDQTAGNPFFLRELWRDLADAGGVDALRSASFQAPTSVRDTLHRRLAGLPETHADVIELAAVAGEAFDVAVLLEASSHPDDVTLDAVDLGVSTGLLAADLASPGRYRFVHALARQAVLDRLAPSRRARKHIGIARALERHGAHGPEVVAQLAHHFDRGQALGHADDAVRYLVRAADHAARSLAYEEAARLYVRAADLTTADPPRDQLLLDAARNRMFAGDFPQARELYERLAGSDDPDVALQAAIGYEESSWRPGMHGARAVLLLEQALQRREPDPDDRVYVCALANLGRALSFTGAKRQARHVGDRALEFARRLDDDWLIGHALRGLLWRGTTPQLAPALLEHAVELTELATALGDEELLLPAAFYRSAVGYLQGLREEWMAGRDDLIGVARIAGQSYYHYVAGCSEYGRQFACGDLVAAEKTVAALDELGREFGSDSTEGSYGVQMFMLQRATGELERVRPLIDGTERIDAHWAPGLLALYTELDMREPADRLLGNLLERVDAYRRDTAQWPGVLAFMVEAAVRLGDVEAAARLRPLAAGYSGRNLLAGQFVAVFGSADRYIAQLDSLLGADTADDHFEQALAMDRRMGATLHQAETLNAWRRHVERHNGTTAARRAANLRAEARVLAERIGYRRVLHDLGIAVAPSAADRELPDGLTGREVDVLRLIADGLSNREIGDRLFISPNTAANHVRSILMKIGAPNRTRAAIYAVDHGLLAERPPAGPPVSPAAQATRPSQP